MDSRKKTFLIVSGLLAGCCVFSLVCGGFWLFNLESGKSGPVVAIALHLDGDSGIYLLVGDPDEDTFWLPGGEYYVEAFDAQHRVYPGFKTVVPARLNGGDDMRWRLDAGMRVEDEQRVKQLTTLADFLITMDYGRLKLIEIVTDGYTAPIATSRVDIQSQEANSFFAVYDQLLVDEAAVTVALRDYEKRALGEPTGSLGAPLGYSGGKLASPLAQGPVGIVAETIKLFGYLGDTGNRVGTKIIDTFDEMSEGDRWKAFEQIPPQLLKGANSPEAMLFKLRRGELWDTASRIHNELLFDPDSPYYLILQDKSKHGNPHLEFIYEEGSEFVKRGVKYNIDIIKFTLKNSFDDIGRGLDFAEQVDRWTQFAYDFYYDDPIKATAGMTYEQIKDAIQERMELDIKETFGEVLDEDDISYFAEQMTGELMSSVDELAPQFIATRIAQHVGGIAQDETPQPEDLAEQQPTPRPTQPGGGEPPPTKEADEAEDTRSETAAPAWIAETVDAINQQLLAEGYDPFEIVNFSNDLQICLTTAAADGFSMEDALQLCADTLSAYTDPEGDFVIEGYRITRSSGTCEEIVYFPNEPAEPLLLILAANGKFVVVESSPETTRWEWQPAGDLRGTTVQATATIVGQELKISALMTIPAATQGWLPRPFQDASLMVVVIAFPAAAIASQSRSRKARRVVLVVITLLSIGLMAQSCTFWGTIRGDYTFPLSEEGFDFLDIPTQNPNLATMPGSYGHVTSDLSSVNKDGVTKNCVTNVDVTGVGVLKRDGIFTPESINFTD